MAGHEVGQSVGQPGAIRTCHVLFETFVMTFLVLNDHNTSKAQRSSRKTNEQVLTVKY